MEIRDIIDALRLPFRKEKELFSTFRAILGFYPRNISLYKQALLHKSVGRRNEKGRPVNNERLEFLGDAILDAVVGDIVYRHFEASVKASSPIPVPNSSVATPWVSWQRRWESTSW